MDLPLSSSVVERYPSGLFIIRYTRRAVPGVTFLPVTTTESTSGFTCSVNDEAGRPFISTMPFLTRSDTSRREP